MPHAEVADLTSTWLKATIIQFRCQHCGELNEYRKPVVPSHLYNDRVATMRSLAQALETIRCDVLDTEGGKAVRIADEALKKAKLDGH